MNPSALSGSNEWEGPEFEALQIFEAFREQGREQWRESQCALACETEAELKAILARGTSDTEVDHSDADDALLRLLDLLGYGFVVEAYRGIEERYREVNDRPAGPVYVCCACGAEEPVRWGERFISASQQRKIAEIRLQNGCKRRGCRCVPRYYAGRGGSVVRRDECDS